MKKNMSHVSQETDAGAEQGGTALTRRVLEKIPMPICAYEIEPPKRVQFMNQKFTEWFGYTIEDIPDMDHWRALAIRDDVYYAQKVKHWYEELEKIRHGEITES